MRLIQRRSHSIVLGIAVASAVLLASVGSRAQGPAPHPKNREGGRPSVISTTSTIDPLFHAAGAIIANGTIRMGINPEGHLNVPAPAESWGAVGLRYIPTGNASTEPGCVCEGWGVAAVRPGTGEVIGVGYANEAVDGVVNLSVESFVAGASTATSTVLVDAASSMGSALRVTHAYEPSPATPNLYQVLVRIENLSGEMAEIRYRRVMDWDIEPTPFNEFVTIQKGTSPFLTETTPKKLSRRRPRRSKN